MLDGSQLDATVALCAEELMGIEENESNHRDECSVFEPLVGDFTDYETQEYYAPLRPRVSGRFSVRASEDPALKAALARFVDEASDALGLKKHPDPDLGPSKDGLMKACQ